MDTLLAVADAAKTFGPTRALQCCSLHLRRGQVHAVLGENGSGKSTLVKILSGVHRPDAGSLTTAGTTRAFFDGPQEALTAGIATVFQEILVVGAQSVLDNVWLGADRTFRVRVDAARKRRLARDVLAELLLAPPDLDVPVEHLSLSEQQACCIARALVRDPQVLILDESTSALDLATRDRLFAILRRRCRAGASTLFISHRMDEIQEIADRVTVLRSGASVASVARGEATIDELVRLMTGAEHLVAGPSPAPRDDRGRSEIVLRTRALRLTPHTAPVEIEVRAGEVIGLAGLEGHGQERFLNALGGRHNGAGDVVRQDGGGATALRTPRQAAAAGVVYVPRDRRAESTFGHLSIQENFALPTLTQDCRAGFLSHRRTRRRLAGYVERLNIKAADPRHPISTLSGGNQQKVVVARWLATVPRVLLLNDPTRGIDLGAKRDLYRELRALAADGVAIVMLSSEVDEHVELMDRVLVFREHAVFAELPRTRLDRDRLVASYFGQEVASGA